LKNGRPETAGLFLWPRPAARQPAEELRSIGLENSNRVWQSVCEDFATTTAQPQLDQIHGH
jgi:hypothetical protein